MATQLDKTAVQPRPKTSDPFLAMFFSRIPSETAETFTEAQLDAVKMAFGARSFGAHAVDIRRSLPWFSRRFYLVFLAGAERRSRARIAFDHRNHPLWNLMNAVVIAVGGLILIAAALGALYTVKRAAGIDVFPGIDVLPDKSIERMLR